MGEMRYHNFSISKCLYLQTHSISTVFTPLWINF
jgi:hypothetical protein